MISLPVATVFWWLIIVHVLGIVSAWMVRIHAGSVRQALYQRVFLIFLGLVTIATIAASTAAPHHWLVSGTTLSLMVLTAVWDFSSSFETEAA